MSKFFLPAIAIVTVTGCSGSSDTSLTQTPGSQYANLFDAPAGKATPDQLGGVWGGVIDRGDLLVDIRLRFDADALTEAARCKWTDGTTLLAGAKGQSRTTPKAEGELCLPLGSGKTRCGEIETLQSVADRKTFGEKWCAVSMTPQAYEYRISGTKARLMLGAEPLDLVKLSD